MVREYTVKLYLFPPSPPPDAQDKTLDTWVSKVSKALFWGHVLMVLVPGVVGILALHRD